MHQRFVILICGLGMLLGIFRAQAIIDASLQMQLGNPTGATADPNNHTNYLVQRPIEALDYNDSRGQANWASWDLTSGDANSAVSRQDSFAPDNSLPAGFYIVQDNEYSGSGYDRGHLCPSADRTDSTNDNDMTFLMSNMMPQAPDNNRITWAGFEDYCRTIADAGHEVLVMCGPSGFNGSHISSSTHVLIASNTWKIAVIVPLGSGTALSRITTTTNRVITINVPNTNGVSANWSNYVTSAHSIELQTGFSFFTALPGPIASAFRAKIDNLVNPPPSISGFSPTAGLMNTNVVITGTNFNTTTSVKFNGVAASFTVDSNTQITTIVPTNATSGTISVTSPTGTATSSSSFSVTLTSTSPDLAVLLSHSGSYTQQDIGDTFTVIVTNVGSAVSSGAISVTNILPTGLTATAITGTGWTTSLANLTATRSDALGVSSAYAPIIVTVSVASNAPVTVTNLVTVSGSGDTNLANNSASDVIQIATFTTNTNSTGNGTNTGTLVGWDVSGQLGGSGNFGPSPLTPTTNAANLTVIGLTRGSGVGLSGSGAVRGWGGTSFTNITAANAISSNQFVTFSLTANSGYKVSYSSISKWDYRRSGTGATNGLLQYKLNLGSFIDITNVYYTNTTTSGSSIGAIDLSSVSGLQGVGPGTNVTFRIVNWGGTSSLGTWYIFDVSNSAALDFAVDGIVSSVPNSPAVAPSISSLSLTNNQFQFTVTGTSGTNYVVQTATNLVAPNWISLTTNTAPFQFIETNLNLSQRFYRSLVAP